MYTMDGQSRGLSHHCSAQGMRLENYYTFMSPLHHQTRVVERLQSSIYVTLPEHVDVAFDRRFVFPEEDDATICVANKPQADGVYFSRVDFGRLLIFFERFGWDAAIVELMRSRKAQLEHQLWSIGWDFGLRGDELVDLKSGFYGSF